MVKKLESNTPDTHDEDLKEAGDPLVDDGNGKEADTGQGKYAHLSGNELVGARALDKYRAAGNRPIRNSPPWRRP